MDYLDDLDEKARRATARARRLAKLLREAGVTVSSISGATQDEDAAVNLGAYEHIQVGVDGTYTRVKEEGGKFLMDLEPVTSAARMVALIAGADEAGGAGAKA
jgi:expansin (peptidoglycan-binding protein)